MHQEAGVGGAFPFAAGRRAWIRILGVAVAAMAVACAGLAFALPVDHDEVEHAHAAFRMLAGGLPYRDFPQNHLPAYWLLGMQWLRAFPFSVRAILAARAVSLLALAGCWALGLGPLGRVRGGRTRLGLAVYSFAVLALACELGFHLARPDPVMALIATAGFCLIPATGSISNARALGSGLLFGLAMSVSPRAAAMALVLPALVALLCLRERRFRPAAALGPYAAGVALGLAPTAWWLLRHGLFAAFRFDVVGLNRALAKPWYESLTYLTIPVLLPSLLGAAAGLRYRRARGRRPSDAPALIALGAAAAVALAVVSRHTGPYNLQAFIVPLALGFVDLVLRLLLRLRARGGQALLCAALIGYPAIHAAAAIVRLHSDAREVPLGDLQALVDLARPGGRTCAAFAPAHPIFCRDVSGLNRNWDVFFAESVRDPVQVERFRRLWRDGIDRTIAARPDLLVRRSPENPWERARADGLVTAEQIEALDRLRPLYTVRRIGSCEVWVRLAR
jgi:hypothetical protein